MSKNKSHNNRKSNTINSKTGLWVKRDVNFDKLDNEKAFKGVRKEALDKLGTTLNKLAKYDKE